MMTLDDKRTLEAIMVRFGLSRKSRTRAIGAVSEWLVTAAPAKQATLPADLLAVLRRAGVVLSGDEKGEAK